MTPAERQFIEELTQELRARKPDLDERIRRIEESKKVPAWLMDLEVYV